MDSELEVSANSATSNGDPTQILTNLLQSLDAGAGGSGPVQSMMKAMGFEPPLVSPEVDGDEGGSEQINEEIGVAT